MKMVIILRCLDIKLKADPEQKIKMKSSNKTLGRILDRVQRQNKEEVMQISIDPVDLSINICSYEKLRTLQHTDYADKKNVECQIHVIRNVF